MLGIKKGLVWIRPFKYMARPERFELPTTWFEARYSIQLSYGRVLARRDQYIRGHTNPEKKRPRY